MSRASQWKKIFGYAEKPKAPVRVGDKVEELTDTQAYRFNELTQSNGREPKTANANPFEQSTYSLAEAAFRLMISEDEILQQAASGSIDLFASVAGLAGSWRRLDADGRATDSAVRTLRSGYLALTVGACKELAMRGGTNASIFDFRKRSDPSTSELDTEVLQELSAWGDRNICFCASHPKWVDRDGIALLAPLVTRV